jgi:hypothetical protein
MRFVKGFAQFWYDFIVGDDWKIAAAVVTALAIGAIVAAGTATGATWVPPLVGALVALAFTVSLVVDVRR